MIYLVCYFSSALLAYFANKTSERKKFLILSFGSILIPTLLAGLRAYSIGIDTESYLTLKRYWHGAVSAESLIKYMKYYMGIGYGEPLFALLCGVIAQVFGHYSVFLFACHAIINSCMYIGAYRLRKQANPAFILLLFYLIFFSHSLNVMRQYIAMAIIFAALADVPKKKYIRYSLLVVLAVMFHTSALLGFGALAIHVFLYYDWGRLFERSKELINKWPPRRYKGQYSDKSSKKPSGIKSLCLLISKIQPQVRRRQILLFAAMALLVLLFNPLCRLVIHMGLLNEKYLWFLDMSRAQHTTLITLFLLVEMSAVIAYHKYLRRQSRLFDFFFTNSGAYLILHQVSLFLVYGKRVAAYFSLANLVTIAMLPRMFRDRLRRTLMYILVLCVVLFYWFYTYILRNASETYPYAFFFS